MNNRRTTPGGQTTHMLSAILAKVTNIEKLLAPAVHNLPD
ncbi:MAG: DNA-binding protein, partial [Bacteroides sp.]|nr:DNA-binding protein [Bacteroides sp.]